MREELNGIYQEIAHIIGADNAKLVFDLLHGQQIVFPQRFYSVKYVTWYVKSNYPEMSVRDLAVKFDYSERHIRKLLNS